ncbi:MFS transporter [Microbacterium sp. NPDC056044]|uniref:MFS transporter n=1 Tax=Microbacterium sp. NPDC056044 TaxID=3345690 RepID=UPI0035DA8574
MTSSLSAASTDELAPARFPLLKKLAYAAGDFGGNYTWTFVSSFALFYLTTVVGLAAAMVGTLMLIARLLDGVTDIVIGGLIDKTRSRRGKARPWLFWSTFPLAISQIMLFNIPAGLNEFGRYAWFFVVYTLLGAFFYTASNLAYTTLLSLVTTDNRTRVSLTSFRVIGALVAVMILTSTTPSLVEAFGGGQLGWGLVATIYAGIFVVFTLITYFAVKELPAEVLAEGIEPPKETAALFWKRFALLLKNHYFWLLVTFFLVNYVAAGLGQASSFYYATYVLNDPSAIGLTTIVSLLPMVILLPFMPALAARISIRWSCVIGGLLGVVGSGIALANNGSVPILLIGLAIGALGQAPIFAGIYTLVASTAENIHLKSGVRNEGTVFACVTIGVKVGSGVGVAIAGWMLSAGSFDATAAVQGPATIAAISAIFLLVPFILSIAKVPLLWAITVERANRRLVAAIDGDRER